jgi:hypothetical protein
MSLNLNKLVVHHGKVAGEKVYIKNEGITRDVIENKVDKNWHPVMLMKNKLVMALTP